MSRAPRDRPAERAAIVAAGERLLAGTPLRSTTGKLTATELAFEAALPRWKVYEHRDLVEKFQAQFRATGALPDAMRDLVAENQRLTAQLAETGAALRTEQARTALLRRALTEASIDLQARTDATTNTTAHKFFGDRRASRTPLLVHRLSE